MISLEQFRSLRQFPTSSWALWSEADEDLARFFEDRIARLRNDVVLLGLNRSGVDRTWSNDYQNFHTPGHRGDAQLKNVVQGQNLEGVLGGYMTDLCEVFETNSAKVDAAAAGLVLEEQLTILGAPHIHIICFGAATFQGLVDFYGLKTTVFENVEWAHVDAPKRRTVFKVGHYSMNGFNNRNATEQLPQQMRTVDSLIRRSY